MSIIARCLGFGLGIIIPIVRMLSLTSSATNKQKHAGRLTIEFPRPCCKRFGVVGHIGPTFSMLAFVALYSFTIGQSCRG